MPTSEERRRKALRLRQRLRELNLTQQAAADRAGVTLRTMENWLAGIGPIRRPVLQLFNVESPEDSSETARP